MAEKNGAKDRELAAVVDDSGRLQAQFGGIDAADDAKSFLARATAGKVKHLHGATVVTGDKAREAMEKGRL
jgi:hypothetical protein